MSGLKLDMTLLITRAPTHTHLLMTVRPGATPSTRSSPPLRTAAEPTSGRNAARGRSREPQ